MKQPSAHSTFIRRISLYAFRWWVVCVIILFLPVAVWIILPRINVSVLLLSNILSPKRDDPHLSFEWLMKHWKVGSYESRESILTDSDTTESNIKIRKRELMTHDLIYITEPMGESLLSSDEDTTGENRRGSLNLEEYELLFSYVKAGYCLIVETPFFSLLNRSGEKLILRSEALLKVRYDAWWGKFMPDLSKSERWIKQIYQAANGQAWHQSGRGIIFIRQTNDSVNRENVVVLEDSDIEGDPLTLHPAPDLASRGLSDGIPYFSSFEIVQSMSKAKVIASFAVNVTEKGKKKLKEAGIPESFPAVIRSQEPFRTFFFAGNFSHYEQYTFVTPWYGVEKILSPLYSFYYVSDQTRFYWRFYAPMMRNLIDLVESEPDKDN